MDPVTQVAVADSVTWARFAYHVFDSVWGLLGSALAGFLTGWLALNKPGFMKAPRTKG
jgi:hypothetical protein